MFSDWFLFAVGAAVASFVTCLAAVPLAKRLDVFTSSDTSHDGKPGSREGALVGGFAVVLPVLAAMGLLFYATRDGFYAGLGVVTFAFLILGYADDRRSLMPAYRLLAALGFSALAIYYSPGLEISFLRFSFMSKSLFLDQWAPVFTVLSIVGIQIAVSVAGDRKGMVPGMMLFWLALLFYHGTETLYPLLSAIAGALAVVLAFSYRGTLSLGNSGAYSLSVLLGSIAVYAYNQGFLLIAADAVALIFLVPVLDFTRLAISRVLDGFSPLTADRRNLLYLLSAVFGQDKAPLIYLGFVAVPNILAILLPAATALLLVLVVLLYAVAYTVLSRRVADPNLA